LRVHLSVLHKSTVFAVEGLAVVASWDVKSGLRVVPSDERVGVGTVTDAFAELVVMDHVDMVQAAFKVAGCSGEAFDTD